MTKLRIFLAVLAASAIALIGTSAALIMVPSGPAHSHYRLIARPTTVSIPDIVRKGPAPGGGQPLGRLAPVTLRRTLGVLQEMFTE